uniref:protein-serine/threonine phosphatase n=1 Tax=Zea mays TaxID=4577 RepID=A0A804NYY6_MAIZE
MTSMWAAWSARAHTLPSRSACALVTAMETARSRHLDAVQSGCSTLSIIKQEDLMVVANVGDSRVVLGTAFDDDAITSSSSSST